MLFAALPQHIAERLRLSECWKSILRLRLRKLGGVASKEMWGWSDGKPEAYRYVLRQSRGGLLP